MSQVSRIKIEKYSVGFFNKNNKYIRLFHDQKVILAVATARDLSIK